MPIEVGGLGMGTIWEENTILWQSDRAVLALCVLPNTRGGSGMHGPGTHQRCL